MGVGRIDRMNNFELIRKRFCNRHVVGRIEKIKCIFSIVKVIGAVVLATIILSALMLSYKYCDNSVLNYGNGTDYKWVPEAWMSTMEEGFSSLHMDANGFNNSHPLSVDSNVDVLVMGSSNMEAVQVKAEENAAYLLANQLNANVYNIGISGHYIYTCVKNLNDAVKEYNPKSYVIIETNTVALQEPYMKQVLDNDYPNIERNTSRAYYLLNRYIPMAKQLIIHLEEWMKSDYLEDESDNQDTDFSSIQYAELINDFMCYSAHSMEGTEAKLIILYQPITQIDESGNMVDTTNKDALLAFSNACELNGIIFVDMTEPFEKLYNEQHQLAHGFVNTAVGTGHLNEYGHKVIADTLAEIINNEDIGGNE